MNFTRCPYNQNHVFSEEKYVWHINRCKDKHKVKNKFKECRFNKLHILPRGKLAKHEAECPDRQTAYNRSKLLQNVIKSCTWTKKETHCPTPKVSIKEQKIEGDSLSECQECQNLLKSIEKGNLPQCKKLRKLLKMYEDAQQICPEVKCIKKEQ